MELSLCEKQIVVVHSEQKTHSIHMKNNVKFTLDNDIENQQYSEV